MARYVAAILLAGCVGGHDATPGTYRVESHVGAACDQVDQPVMNPVPYLEVYKSGGGIIVSTCAAANNCPVMHTLSDRDGDAYTGGEGYAQTYENGRICQLGYTSYSARFDGDALAFEIISYGETIGLVTCTQDEAIRRGTSMPCGTHELLDARRQ